MKFKNPFKQLNKTELITAGFQAACQSQLESVNVANAVNAAFKLFGYGGSKEVYAQEAYDYYESICTLETVVGDISSIVSDLPLVIQKKDDDALETDHEFFEILSTNGGEVEPDDLLRELTLSQMLTRESWLIFRGPINKPPTSVSYTRPYFVSPEGNYELFGKPDQIRVQAERDNRIYYLHYIDGKIRYLDDLTPELAGNELFPIIGIVSKIDEFRGLSPLKSLRYELEQLSKGGEHNTALLSNGMRPSYAITPKTVAGAQGDPPILSDDHIKAIEKSLEAHKDSKKGGTLMLPTPLDIKDMLLTHRDAEYSILQERADRKIYLKYNVPLPMSESETMTYNNLAAAYIGYFDRAIDGATRKLFPGIIRAFATRYPELYEYNLTYNQFKVAALQSRFVDMMKNLSETNAVKIDEVRKAGGKAPLPDGLGDRVFVPQTLQPVTDEYEEM